MKGFPVVSTALVLALWAGAAGCRKAETKAKTVATVAQDTMLLHDLAEANKNTAAAAAVDNSLNTVMESSSGTAPALSAETPQNRAAVVPRPTVGTGGQVLTSGPRLTAPTRANDAPAPTNVPIDRSPASATPAPASGDLCDSPAPADQRSCLNRSIVASDADLNRTYQDLIAQSRKSGGPDLEARIRQSQREWVNQRDAGCRADTQGAGRLWARAVAKCLADYSDRRAAELHRQLAGLQGQ
jgi:uncharacterized protein YecT (DUF1311 family)